MFIFLTLFNNLVDIFEEKRHAFIINDFFDLINYV
jgi:hypothetical protein